MTVHTAKGLEFPYVFVTGMEDGTFPHRRSLDDPAELAEERRLAYVAITRARKRLYLSRAATRSAWGQAEEMAPSRFLDQLPEENIERRNVATRDTVGSYLPSSSSSYSGSAGGGQIFGSGIPGSLPRRTPKNSRVTHRLGEAPANVTKKLGGSGKLGQSNDKPRLVLAVGDSVQHGTLGVGTVIGLEGSGDQTVARIDFGGKTKRLLVRMAPLKKL